MDITLTFTAEICFYITQYAGVKNRPSLPIVQIDSNTKIE